MIRFRNITKIYGVKTLFQDLSFNIQSKELVALTGKSGVGKSTLVHMLIGAEKPDSGSIEIDGFDIAHLRKSELQLMRRSMGVIFQDFKLLPQKNVFENVAFAMEVCGNSDAEIEMRVPQVLKKVALSDAEHKFPQQLSGGEKQRVAIARALVHKPKLLVGDEPTGNLDPPNTKEIGDILKTLNEEGITIIIATHDKELVNHLHPRVLYFENGTITHDEKHGKFLGNT
jgi:cell division transport system ATP-binding protein